MDAILQTTFSNAFSWMKMFEFRLKFHWSLFLRFQSTIFQHWFRYWLGAVQATSHYLNQWWLVYWRVYASLGLNELSFRYGRSSDIIEEIGTWWYKRCATKWLFSYLSGRQYVNFQNTDSDKMFIKRGLPQGSILGPLLFLVFINDLHNVSSMLS